MRQRLRACDGSRVKLCAITHVPTSGGLIQPAAKIGEVAFEYGVPYLLDACQSVGQLDLDVDTLRCDALAATSRKYIRGPRGSGFLYCRADSAFSSCEPSVLDVRSAHCIAVNEYELEPDFRRFENWERSYVTWLGMGSALELALKLGLKSIEERVVMLARRLRGELMQIAGVTVTDTGERRCGIVGFTVAGVSAEAVKTHLAQHHVHVSVSRAPSTYVAMRARGLGEVVRASVHYYNTEQELTHFICCLRALTVSPASSLAPPSS
mmetsp:Transcript_15116/g.40534  ORF Transcript_15116/g.40534 Transcript_15116/m.40534 type:complete len:266 (-) Transcript_15116:679-1476(-)